MNTTDTKMMQRLAAALEVNADEVLGFKKYPSGYAVIMKDYRKFTHVQPADPQPVAPAAPAQPQLPGLPPELQDVWRKPASHTVPELKALAKELGIPDYSTLLKASLIEEIELLKEEEE